MPAQANGTEGPLADARLVKAIGNEAKFDAVYITSAASMPRERAHYLEWVRQGRHGEMGWITPDRARSSSDPSTVLDGARSVVCVAMAYWNGPRRTSTSRGKIARYAWGMDYHAVLAERLEYFADTLRARFGGNHRWYVDTGPVMDKALAARSGLGWYGKNTNILTERFGSFVVLGEVITTLALAPDPPASGNCGSCSLCLTACPTGALDAAYRIDGRRCISYLTIEHRAAIPLDLRPLMGTWVFGCDICQDVCPPSVRPYLDSAQDRRAWVRSIREQIGGSAEPFVEFGSPVSDGQSTMARSPLLQDVDLFWLLDLSHDVYVDTFRGTAIRRAKAWMLRRNAAVALGNIGNEDAVRALSVAAAHDDHPVVRGHAAWALGQIGARTGLSDVETILQKLRTAESDQSVRQEIEWALQSTIGRAGEVNPFDSPVCEPS